MHKGYCKPCQERQQQQRAQQRAQDRADNFVTAVLIISFCSAIVGGTYWIAT